MAATSSSSVTNCLSLLEPSSQDPAGGGEARDEKQEHKKQRTQFNLPQLPVADKLEGMSKDDMIAVMKNMSDAMNGMVTLAATLATKETTRVALKKNDLKFDP